jgi:hypothetical protein
MIYLFDNIFILVATKNVQVKYGSGLPGLDPNP